MRLCSILFCSMIINILPVICSDDAYLEDFTIPGSGKFNIDIPIYPIPRTPTKELATLRLISLDRLDTKIIIDSSHGKPYPNILHFNESNQYTIDVNLYTLEPSFDPKTNITELLNLYLSGANKVSVKKSLKLIPLPLGSAQCDLQDYGYVKSFKGKIGPLKPRFTPLGILGEAFEDLKSGKRVDATTIYNSTILRIIVYKTIDGYPRWVYITMPGYDREDITVAFDKDSNIPTTVPLCGDDNKPPGWTATIGKRFSRACYELIPETTKDSKNWKSAYLLRLPGGIILTYQYRWPAYSKSSVTFKLTVPYERMQESATCMCNGWEDDARNVVPFTELVWEDMPEGEEPSITAVAATPYLTENNAEANNEITAVPIQRNEQLTMAAASDTTKSNTAAINENTVLFSQVKEERHVAAKDSTRSATTANNEVTTVTSLGVGEVPAVIAEPISTESITYANEEKTSISSPIAGEIPIVAVDSTESDISANTDSAVLPVSGITEPLDVTVDSKYTGSNNILTDNIPTKFLLGNTKTHAATANPNPAKMDLYADKVTRISNTDQHLYKLKHLQANHV